LMTNPNFLILDEPTNDLDLVTLRKLEDFLENFEGCLLVVTHDRYFMDRLVDHLFVFEGDGKTRDFPGSYSQYRTSLDKQKAEAEAETPKEETPKSPKSRETSNRKRKLSFNEQREYDQLGEAIEQMEARKAELEELIASGTTDFEALTAWTQEFEQLGLDIDTKKRPLAGIDGDRGRIIGAVPNHDPEAERGAVSGAIFEKYLPFFSLPIHLTPLPSSNLSIFSPSIKTNGLFTSICWWGTIPARSFY
ncbi:MAG: hypothetical protein AAF206_20070, partial [Bacteroidota bacterium]